jgi:hypothetical protein
MAVPVIIQNASVALNATGVATIEVALPAPVVAGRLLVLCIAQSGSGARTYSVSDNRGNTWVTGPFNGGGGQLAQISYVVQAAAGSTTVTVTQVTGSANYGVYLAEVAGADPTAPLAASDVFIATTVTAHPSAPEGQINTPADCLIFGAGATSVGSSIYPAPGFTTAFNSSDRRFAQVGGFAAPQTAQRAIWTTDSAISTKSALAAFKGQVITEAPTAPSNVQATTARHPLVSWTRNSSNESGFYVHRRPAGSAAPTNASTRTSPNLYGTEWRDYGTAPLTQYDYWVEAWNDVGSTFSATPATVTTSAATGPEGDAAPPVSVGIWISKAELDTISTTGNPYWTGTGEVKTVADGTWPPNRIEDMGNQGYHQYAMAGALVFARLKPTDGSLHAEADAMRAKVANAIETVMAYPDDPAKDVTAPARNLAAWVIAADLINLREYSAGISAAFDEWIIHKLYFPYSNFTIHQAARERPNNIGSSARFSWSAVAAYLGDTASLAALAVIWRRFLGDDMQLPSEFVWGANVSWHANPSDSSTYVGINPAGAVRNGHNFDGIQPDDQRRHDELGPTGGVYDPADFPNPQGSELYVYGAWISSAASLLIMSRSGYPGALQWGNGAMRRAAEQVKRFADAYGAKGWVYFTSTRAMARPLANYMYSLGYPTDMVGASNSLDATTNEISWTFYTHLGRTAPDDFQRSFVVAVASTTAETLMGSTVHGDIVAALRDQTTATGVELPDGTHKFELSAFLAETRRGHEIRYAYQAPPGKSLKVELRKVP